MSQKALNRKVIQAGQSIFSQGEIGDRAFIVQEGEVNILKKNDVEDLTIATIGKGGIFGEMALIDDKPRMASAIATELTTVIIVSREIFKDKLRKTDPFIKGLLNIFVDAIRRRN